MILVLKENTWEIRKKINDAGIRLCGCTEFDNAVWLDYSGLTHMVHGLGYADEEYQSAEQILARFQAENKDVVYCNDVDEFIEKIKECKC